MTNEIAIHRLLLARHRKGNTDLLNEALDMAIEALRYKADEEQFWAEQFQDEEPNTAELPSAQPSDEYERGWKDGQEALREEIWEDERDRLD